MVTITDPLGRVSSVTKNQKGQVIKEEDAAGNTVEYLYESGSSKVAQKVETEKGSSKTHTTRYEYVQGDKLSKIVENVGTPLQRVTTFLYDEKGNLIGSVDPAGHAVSHEYDPQGRRIRTTRELEKGERVTAAMAYDSLNNLTSLTDSLGNRTEYTYDPLGRLSKVTYPDGSTQEYSYDSAGNLLQEKKRSGTLIANNYDNGNRLISRTITKAQGVEGTSTESYIYDGLNRLTKGTNDVSVVERRYDSLSRLIEEVQDGKSVQYGYDKVGNTTRLVYPNQRVIEREFDILNRISRVKQGSDVISTMEFLGRSYRLASKGYQNGDLVKYLYDQGRRLTGSETKNKNQTILQSFGWGYDTLDLKSFEKRLHNGGKGDAFSYDALKRLTNVTFDSPTPETPGGVGVKSKAITLDKLDNILKITDNENAMVTEIIGELEGKGKALNQYSRFNDLPLEYDTNGNLSAKGSRLFSYDYRNRLIRSSKGDDAVTFTYDIFGRQTSRTDVSGTCHYFYAGDQKIEERNASGQVTKHYFWGNGIDELLRLDIYNGTIAKPYYVHTDSIGSTTTVTDENGNLVERVRYDAYGIPTFTDALGQSLKKSSIGNTTLFQGREYDYDLALYNYRARYFDPTLGRFLQTDPLGYQDSMNLYQGMGMNPVNFVDPWGEYISIISNPKEIVWLLRFGVSESAWEYIDATKLDGQTIIDPVLISKYQGNDLNMVRLKAMAMDKSKITEIMTADEYKYINIKYPLDEMNPGYTYDSKNLNEIGNGGAFNRVQYGASLAVGVKVVTLAHELYVHAYLEAQGKEHRHFQGNVDNEEIKIEECAKINFNNFIKKWKYGKNVFNLKMYALAKKAREDYNRVNKNKMTDEQYEDVLRFNFRDYQKKKNEFYDFIIEKWDEYWRSFL